MNMPGIFLSIIFIIYIGLFMTLRKNYPYIFLLLHCSGVELLIANAKKRKNRRALVAHVFNASTRETEAGGSLWVWYPPVLQRECLDRLQSYTEKPWLKKPKKKERETSIWTCADFLSKITMLPLFGKILFWNHFHALPASFRQANFLMSSLLVVGMTKFTKNWL